MKTTSTSSGAKKKKKGQGLKPLSLIGIAIMLVMLLQMVLLLTVSKTSEGSSPALVYYGTEIKLPEASLKTVMSAAGFDMYEAQGDSFSRETVILAAGTDAFDVMQKFADDPNVMGFVLVDPSFPGNAAMEGFNRFYPDKPVAVFSGNESWSSVSDLPDEALLYERMTGDDTVYGAPVVRGRILPSKVYINNEVNRYLSFASYGMKGDMLLYSPVFQNELAGYLSSVYHDHVSKISYTKVNMRLFFFVMSVFGFIAGLLIYVAPMSPAVSPSLSKGRAVILLVASLAVSAAVFAAGAFVRNLAVLRSVSLAAPMIFGISSGAAVLLNNMKDNRKLSFRGKGRALRPLFMILVTAGFVLLFSLLTGDKTGSSRILPIVLVACTADVLIQSVTFASATPSFSTAEMLIMMIPVPVMIAAAYIFGCPMLLVAVPALIFPVVFSRFIRNISDYSYLAAFAHGLILGISVLLG